MDTEKFKNKINDILSRINSNLSLIEVKGDSVQYLFTARLFLQELSEYHQEIIKEESIDKLNKEV